ncbi:uncharacterized protein KY384_006200 [Bacidia gigantensis]|uniref:uncharacterized protein n=1 Tax=Bacidia gigantensis TaxID=2732470 RepID=UPI001D038131|nr:uncharacterized protein KY384_006200 [Bacidia gigantensis]KAG8529563.1 hypothetical protein KY384_006200 [Bacidia gigantensis]
MTEVLGIIGVAPLAVQLIEKVDKLSSFLKSVKGAPKEFETLLTEATFLSETLQEFEKLQNCQGEQSLSNGLASRALKMCQDVCNTLQSILDEATDGGDYQRALCSRRTLNMASFKLARKRDRISHLMPQIQRTLMSLLVVNQLMLQSKLDLMIRRTRTPDANAPTCDKANFDKAIAPTGNLALSPDQHLAPPSRWTQLRSFWLFLGTIHYQSTTDSTNRTLSRGDSDQPNQETAWRLRLHLAHWLGGRGVSFHPDTNSSNWQYVLKPCNMTKPDSPIFEACRKGDILHIAAHLACPDICQLLIERGSDANEIYSRDIGTPLMALAESAPLMKFKKHPSIQDTVRVLVEQGRCDPLLGSSRDSNVFSAWQGDVESFRYLRSHENFNYDKSGWLGLDPGTSIYHRHLMHIIFYLKSLSIHYDRKEWLKTLWSKEDGPLFTTVKDKYDRNVLHCCPGRIAYYGVWKLVDSIYLDPLLQIGQIASRLIECHIDLHARDKNGQSPMWYMLRLAHRQPRGWSSIRRTRFSQEPTATQVTRRKTDIIRWWLNTIANSGKDLTKYIRTELALQPEGITFKTNGGKLSINLKFEDGFNADSVRIEESFVAKEPRRPKMPGSWQ